MKLTDAQWGVLYSLDQLSPQSAVEVLQPPSMSGERKVKLEWNLGNTKTLAVLEANGLVDVQRQPYTRPKDATGRPGNPRRMLTVSVSDKGRAMLAAALEAKP